MKIAHRAACSITSPRIYSSLLLHQAWKAVSSPNQRARRSRSTNTPSNDGPLQGIRVLDFGRVLAAPFCTQILADYGADVIKIEQPGTGDDTRKFNIEGDHTFWKASASESGPMSLYFAAMNRNKRSVTLDLKQRSAVEAVHRLAEAVDIVFMNFIPGRADKLGIGYDELSKINPRLIYCSLSGYGSTGPYASRAGYDAIAAAEGGLMHITGHPNGPPVRPGLGMIDMATGLYAHGAIMAALWQRQTTERGQFVDVSLFETQISMLGNVGTAWLNAGKEGRRIGSGHPSVHPMGIWQCGDKIYLSLAVTNDRQFKVLCERIERLDLLDDERFATNNARVANRDAMDEVLTGLFQTRPVDEWLRMLDGSGLAAGSVNNIERAMEHSQLKARDMVNTHKWDEAQLGEWKNVGVPVKFSDSKPILKRLPPKLGQHTEEVLKEVGYNDENIERMRSEGAI